MSAPAAAQDARPPTAPPTAPDRLALAPPPGDAQRAHDAVRRALGSAPPYPAASAPPAPPVTGWRLTERALRLGTVAALAAAAALATGQAWLLALAAGPAVLLAFGAAAGTRPTRVAAHASTAPQRCFEGEPVTARIDLAFDGLAGWIDPAVTPGPGVELTGVSVHGAAATLEFTARRWGRWTLGTADLDLHDAGGLNRRTVRVELGDIDVYPLPADASLTPIPQVLPDRIGEHSARQNGEGFEFTGVRPYTWGERQRRIHWPSTTRRGTIQVNQYAAQRTADTVVLLDALGDVRDPASGRSSLDDAVRATAGITRAYLRSHDRVGVVSIGGKLRWLQPGTGANHLYRIVETVLEVRRDLGYAVPDIGRVPPPALPRGALVYAVTPLADDRFLDALRDLAERGNPVTVIEVPTGDPSIDPQDPASVLALRLWRLDRAALRYSLTERGIPVLAWDGQASLDLALAPLMRTGVRGRTR
ncbi:MAG TPA: DUF58 domain-containing protein [Actinocrinis sp.]